MLILAHGVWQNSRPYGLEKDFTGWRLLVCGKNKQFADYRACVWFMPDEASAMLAVVLADSKNPKVSSNQPVKTKANSRTAKIFPASHSIETSVNLRSIYN
ncbi:hypothetical protein [Erwinia sp. 198]|uniref:hypothetical protein n=1 Tax=Erwinia sp. 198 TaxID=2022746 RepID=UPI000F66BA86|nr:hypothetical protein [Erwinia sp. 198]